MIKTEDKTIDDFVFTVTQFPAMYAFGLLARILKAVGPAIGQLGSLDPNMDVADAGPQLAAALSSLDPDEAQDLALAILKSASVLIPDATGSRRLSFSDKVKIDEFFTGKLLTMFKVLGFAVSVNFADFAKGNSQLVNAVPHLS